MPSREKFVQET